MKMQTFVALVILLFTVFSSRGAEEVIGNDTAAVRDLIVRAIGERADDFALKLEKPSGDMEAFEIKHEKGKILISGNSTNALTRGFYDYLKNACHSQITWGGKHLNLPGKLPEIGKKRVETPYQFRLYYNVCTFGYTTPFWDWEEWEKEIDWMALRGINMPLAMVGTEAIWQRVWKKMGITDQELEDYFTGPAFLPWHRMGNVNKHGGPLPQSWLDGKRELQKKILNRMRELGIEPVVPAFSGFVPKALKRIHPEAEIIDMEPWTGFPEEYGTYMLSPLSPLFTEIGKSFINEYEKEYGDVKYYLADCFNEMKVPVTKEGRYQELDNFGQAVYKSLIAGDPEAVWVMQGWLFYCDSGFWDQESVKAFLRSIPDDRMIIVDLYNDDYHGWKEHDGFYGKQWIYSVIHNFGGNNPFFGTLEYYGKDPGETLKDPAKGKLVGFGISPEGVENNEVIYEILTDAAWTSEPIEIKSWLRDYCLSRYGDFPAEMEKAWEGLLKSVYQSGTDHVRHGWQYRPGLSPAGEGKAPPEFEEAVKLFFSCADKLSGSELFVNDLIELTGYYIGVHSELLIRKAGELHTLGFEKERDFVYGEAFTLIEELDALFATQKRLTLERWIEDARRWGKNEKEKALMEDNVKRQITVWGGPVLAEYAAKVWSGLIRDYYLPRWRMFHESLKKGEEFEFSSWEEEWISTPGNLSTPAKVEDPVKEAKRLFEKTMKLKERYTEFVKIRTSQTGSNEKIKVTLLVADRDADIYYTLDGKNPTGNSELYQGPFEIEPAVKIVASAFRNGEQLGYISRKNIHLASGGKVEYKTPYSSKYKAGGERGLTDGINASGNYGDGFWQGFEGVDFEAVIDLGKPKEVSKITVNFLSDLNVWIFPPLNVEFAVSNDRKSFKTLAVLKNEKPLKNYQTKIRNFNRAFEPEKARYIKVKAKNIGKCPEWHPGANGKAWLFVDEITVE